MTIAAAFKFDQGIVVCADTEQTLATLKISRSKVIPHEINTGNAKASLLFCISGDVAHATMAVQEIIAAIDRQGLTFPSIRSVVKEHLLGIHVQYVFPHPATRDGTGPSFQIIVAGSTADKPTWLLSTSDAAVTEEDKYTCLGAGYSLADFLADLLYETPALVNKESAILLAVYILRQVKTYVPYCGGSSEVWVLNESGEMTSVDAREILDMESFLIAFDSMLSLFFSALSDPSELVITKNGLLVAGLRMLLEAKKDWHKQKEQRALELLEKPSRLTRSASQTSEPEQ